MWIGSAPQRFLAPIALLSLYISFHVLLQVEALDFAKDSTAAMVAIDVGDEDEDNVVDVGSRDESFIDPDIEEFIPTHEWQVVQKGQAVPPGLHIRFNMEAGTSEAKLYDGDQNLESNQKQPKITIADSATPGRVDTMAEAIKEAMKELGDDKVAHDSTIEYWSEDGKAGMKKANGGSFTVTEMKEALKKFKSSSDDVQDAQVASESARQTFRSMSEIKEDIADLHLNLKSDVEIVRGLKAAYEQPDIDRETRISILEDLEYYLHQIDNAVDFTVMGGLTLLIGDLNHTERDVRTHVCLTLGSACQSNPKVQRAAFDNGALAMLIRLLSLEGSMQTGHVDTTETKSRIIYAMSAILRHFPEAQAAFLQAGGLEALGSILLQPNTDKLRVKVISLVNDLLGEQRDRRKLSDGRHTEHNDVDLMRVITERGWCQHYGSLLTLTAHDAREKVFHAMSSLVTSCHQTFASSLDSLISLRSEYASLAEEEQKQGDGDYYSSMNSLIKSLVTSIYVMMDKDEL